MKGGARPGDADHAKYDEINGALYDSDKTNHSLRESWAADMGQPLRKDQLSVKALSWIETLRSSQNITNVRCDWCGGIYDNKDTLIKGKVHDVCPLCASRSLSTNKRSIKNTPGEDKFEHAELEADINQVSDLFSDLFITDSKIAKSPNKRIYRRKTLTEGGKKKKKKKKRKKNKYKDKDKDKKKASFMKNLTKRRPRSKRI